MRGRGAEDPPWRGPEGCLLRSPWILISRRSRIPCGTSSPPVPSRPRGAAAGSAYGTFHADGSSPAGIDRRVVTVRSGVPGPLLARTACPSERCHPL